MTKGRWVKKIKEACEAAGTYEPYFENAILTLAEILEKRDEAAQMYKEDGERPVIMHINKANQENMTKNPILVVWDDLNKSALAYWRDLGLTPAGLRNITKTAPGNKKRSRLEEALEKLTNEGKTLEGSKKIY